MSQYQGSDILMPLSNAFHLPIDQINFITTQACAILLGIVFRTYLKPCEANILKRHIFNTVFGVFFGFFCFGYQMQHLILESFLCYMALLFCPRKYVQIVIFTISMAYLSLLNIYDIIYNYGVKIFDITVLMMITTQKFTSLGFSYYDGMKPAEKLIPDQKNQAIIKIPSVIEYLSYVFNFQGITVGPLCYYQDYMDFITGRNVLKHSKPKHLHVNGNGKSNGNGNGAIESDEHSANESDGHLNGYTKNGNGKALNGNGHSNHHAHEDIVYPSVKKAVTEKAITLAVLAVFFLKVCDAFPVEDNLKIVDQPLWYRILYFYVSIPGHRIKYYIAWVLGDLVNNVSGMGFNGYDEKGEPQWNLITNVNIIEYETSTSMKAYIDNWNIQTRIWLRRIAFDRLPAGKTLGVFVLSAFWHGFYPGYYLTFILAAFLVYAGRGIRRKIRPLFIDNNLQVLYSIITWIFASFALNYCVYTFIVLEFGKSIQFYNSWYWFVHIVGITLAFALPSGSSMAKGKPKEKQKEKKEQKNED